MTVVLGVDPGATNTGLVLRKDDLVVDVATVVRPKDETDVDYLKRVRTELLVIARHNNQPGFLVGVEAVKAPKAFINGRMKFTDPGPAIGTALVAGLLVGLALQLGWHVVLVPPMRNGSSPLSSYPARLVGEREKSGGGKLRHARSAYDVAGAAAQMCKVGAA